MMSNIDNNIIGNNNSQHYWQWWASTWPHCWQKRTLDYVTMTSINFDCDNGYQALLLMIKIIIGVDNREQFYCGWHLLVSRLIISARFGVDGSQKQLTMMMEVVYVDDDRYRPTHVIALTSMSICLLVAIGVNVIDNWCSYCWRCRAPI